MAVRLENVASTAMLMFILLCSALLATTLQGVQGEVDVEGPLESQCRPYIEKALKKLETGDALTADGQESSEDSIARTVTAAEDATDDSEASGEETEPISTPDEGGEKSSAETVTNIDDSQESVDVETKESQEDETKESVEADSKDSAEGDTKESAEEQAENKESSEVTNDEEAGEEKSAENLSAEDETQETTKETEEAQSIETEENKSEEVVKSSEVEGEETTENASVQEGSEENKEETEEVIDMNTSAEASSEKDESVEKQEIEEKEATEEKEASDEKETSEEHEEINPSEGSIEQEIASEETVKEETQTEDNAVPEDATQSSEETKEETATSAEEDNPTGNEASSENATSDEKAASKEDSKEETNVDASTEQSTESSEAAKDGSEEEKKENISEEKKDESGEQEAGNEAKSEEESNKSAEEKEGETVESDKGSVEEQLNEGVAQVEGEEKEQADDSAPEVEEKEPVPEEDLMQEFDIPTDLRPRNHIGQLLHLDEESTGAETNLNRAAEIILKELKRLYENAIKPLEILYKYRDLSNRHFGDPEIFSKPLVLFMGPWSGGKSSIINYLLDNEYKQSSLRTGAEPSPAYFNILMHGDEPEVLDGTQLAADWTFSGLQKFGQGLEDRLRGLKLPSKLLEKINIVEIPGILEVRKQVSRMFPFNDACQWFIDRADIIFLVYDPSKLDVGPETEAILDQLKGREYQTRIILNKADQVKPEELMRVQGALIWNISPLMSSAQPPVMYSTSLWSRPYELGAPVRLLQAQERAFLRDLRTAVDKRIENKISSARRFAVRVRNHAKMVDCYLTTYYNHKSVFGNKKLVSDQIIEHPQDYHIYEGLSTLTNISRYDLPDPDVYRDFFRLNPLYDFQQLSATCTYFRGCPINRLDVAIAYDFPELVGKYKKMIEQSIANDLASTTKS